MVIPWLYHGYTMVIPWLYHAWLYHGYTMVIPWLYHVKPWLYHGYTMVNNDNFNGFAYIKLPRNHRKVPCVTPPSNIENHDAFYPRGWLCFKIIYPLVMSK